MMKTLALAALLLSATTAFAADKKQGISISFDSDDARTRIAARHVARDARLAVPTENGAAVLLLTNDVVAVQLSDAVLARIETKSDANFLEELVSAGVGIAIRKSVEYPLANIRSAEVQNGNLVLTNDEGKPVFADLTVNGENVTHALSTVNSARFVNAFRAVKARR